MCLPIAAVAAIAGAVVTAGGQIYSGMAANAQGKYAHAVAQQNAGLEKTAQADAISRQETAQQQHYRRLAQAMGEARVRNSAAGLDVGFGSAADLESDIALIGYEDSATLAANANKETRGYDISMSNYLNQGNAARAQGKAALVGGLIGATGTLLTTASQQLKANKSPGGGLSSKSISSAAGSPASYVMRG